MTTPSDHQADLPEPLTPADCDLQAFEFMPLSVQRLRDSDMLAVCTAEECLSAILLWCASWHQVPAASLPDDDRVLSNLAGYGRAVAEWQRVKAGALRGFVKCRDGRLYHPVVAEKALESWASREKKQYASDMARAKKVAQREGRSFNAVSLAEWRLQRDAGLWITSDRAAARAGVQSLSRGQDPFVPGTRPLCPGDKTPLSRDFSRQEKGKGKGISPLPPTATAECPGDSAATARPTGIDGEGLATGDVGAPEGKSGNCPGDIGGLSRGHSASGAQLSRGQRPVGDGLSRGHSGPDGGADALSGDGRSGGLSGHAAVIELRRRGWPTAPATPGVRSAGVVAMAAVGRDVGGEMA